MSYRYRTAASERAPGLARVSADDLHAFALHAFALHAFALHAFALHAFALHAFARRGRLGAGRRGRQIERERRAAAGAVARDAERAAELFGHERGAVEAEAVALLARREA